MDIKKSDLEVVNQNVQSLIFDSMKSSQNMFKSNNGFHELPTSEYQDILKKKILIKVNDEYGDCLALNKVQREKSLDADQLTMQMSKKEEQMEKEQRERIRMEETVISKTISQVAESQENDKLSKIPKQFLLVKKEKKEQNMCEQLVPVSQQKSSAVQQYQQQQQGTAASRIGAIMVKKLKKIVKPEWHAPWKLMRVIIGHQGWVRCIDVDKNNEWFVSSGSDRMIKFWELATGKLKLTLTGHVSTVRKVAIAKDLMYMFSCAEDKTIKCWDLEYNKIVRNYHGHLSGVYSLAVHPTLNLIASGGRDATVRLWDIRTRTQVHVLAGHDHVVSSVLAQEFEPQIISGGHDNMIKLWDIGMGKAISTLTNHKKAIRDMSIHPSEYTWVSAAADNLKVWKCPEGNFLRNISGHNSILNCVAINRDNVLMAGTDNGALHFWDWKSGYKFQQIQSKVQPGSISAEGGIFCAKFDQSSLRLLTGECDKTIKIWKEDETATPETHPVADISMQFDQHKF